MANNLNTNPIIIDTFTSDVTIFSTICHPKLITFNTDTAGNRLVLEDVAGNHVVDILMSANNTTYDLWLPEGWQSNGLVLDISDGTYDTCKMLIYH